MDKPLIEFDRRIQCEGRNVSVSRKLTKTGKKPKFLRSDRDWENYRDLLIVLLQKDLKVRYNNKILGYLWSVANPLASAMVFYIAFSILVRWNIPNYPLVLISGVFPWQWFTNVVGSSPNLFVGNASIIKKVNFPRNIVLICAVLNHMIHFVISIPIIVLFLYLFNGFGRSPSLTWLYGIPVMLLLHGLTVYGIGLVLSSINLFFRDLERLTSIVLNLLFYFTPILYPLDQIPPKFVKFIWLNPAAPLIVNWRDLFLNGQVNHTYLLISALYALLFLGIGQLIYNKLSWKFAEVI
jgi:lipopolysaccharide transport system permease protein